MIITDLRGGLGNQLFQYAAGRALSLKLNTPLLLDTSWYAKNTTDTARECSIERYSISAKIMGPEQRGYARYPHYRARRLLKPLGLIPVFYPCLLTEKPGSYNTHFFERKGDTYLRGFWQSYKYFENIRPQILEDLTLRSGPSNENARLIEQIDAAQSIAVHVRRGDYVNSPGATRHHGICSSEYYETAHKQIAKTLKKPVTFVFSDDLDWCRDTLKLGGELHFVDNNQGADPSEDLRLLQHCTHFVLSNSTFSWWGAWLSQEKNKTVIVPKNWYADGTTVQDLIPPEWIRL